MSERAPPPERSSFAHFTPMTTRWMDNDVYGHVNNVQYYSWFDTAVNAWLISRGLLDPATSPVIGLVAETRCRYFAPVSFPEAVEVGLAVSQLGRSSVTYATGLFRAGQPQACAAGHFTHVYVQRATGRPIEIPPPIRDALLRLKPKT